MLRTNAEAHALCCRSRGRSARSSAWLPAALLAAGLTAGTAAPAARAEMPEIPFDEAEVFFELNDTDGDLGIHALIDGDAWKKLKIEDPSERKILDVDVRGRLMSQGLTELFFESDEPSFDELAPEEFFARFPEGTYEVEGESLDGEELESETEVTHVMPAPPEVRVNGGEAAEDCDAELPTVGEPVVLSWDEVTESHPDLGRSGEPVVVVNYEVVVEIDETPFRTSTILPPSARSFVVPAEIIAARDPEENEVKFEILVREESYNQTAVESCFEVE